MVLFDPKQPVLLCYGHIQSKIEVAPVDRFHCTASYSPTHSKKLAKTKVKTFRPTIRRDRFNNLS